jgi:hypothetical protein
MGISELVYWMAWYELKAADEKKAMKEAERKAKSKRRR